MYPYAVDTDCLSRYSIIVDFQQYCGYYVYSFDCTVYSYRNYIHVTESYVNNPVVNYADD